jgi:hypothetical protein
MRKTRRLKLGLLVILTVIIILGYGGLCGTAITTNSGSSGGTFLIITNSASDITQTSAVLNGTVNPNGVITKVSFQWRRNDNLFGSWNNTPVHSIGSGTAEVTVSYTVTVLTPNTQYNFRLVASRGSTTSFGSNQPFTTEPAPPACTTDAASNTTPDSARLNGTVNPNALTTTAYFNYGLTTSYTFSTTPQPIGSGNKGVAVWADISGLSPETQYNFRVVGINSIGTAYGNNKTFTTGAPPGSAPTCTTDATSNITPNSARLNGTVIPNRLATNVYFNYGLTTSYTFTTTPQAIGNGSTSVAVWADISGLLPNTGYNFRVVGRNDTGTTCGNNQTFTTKPPTTCTTNPADNITPNSARLNGTINPNGLSTNAYFNYGLTTSYTVTTISQAIGSGTTTVTVSADISGLSSNTVYNFRCAAFNTSGTIYGTNRTFGHWSGTTFPSGLFTNTQSTNSNNDVILLATSNWFQRSLATSPSPRCRHAMAYDSVRQKTVLFGGFSSTFHNETWEWDGTNWTQYFPVTSPSGRGFHAMAYDFVRQKTVLFGGCDNNNGGGVFNNETWEWDGTNWTLRSPTTSPSVRNSHAMAYDSVNKKIVLFGGNNGTVYNDEMWEWDGTNWLQHFSTTVTPSARCGHAMVYDSVRQKIVLFGGNPSNNETWEWDVTNWTWTKRSPTTSPSARNSHMMAYDSFRQRTVLFGGFALGAGNTETWEWDGANWTKRSPTSWPSARWGHAMAYDSFNQRTVLFGGYMPPGVGNGETWEWVSSYVSSGTYVSESITPTGVSSWGVLTFTCNAPANTTFTVDVLKSSDNSVLVTNVSSGTDLSTYLNGVSGIKLCANFATTNTSITPTLFDWGVGYEGQ